MQNPVLTKLEAARKELLDLGLRNPLINFKPLRGRGLEIVDERSAIIYDILVRKGKTMTFLGQPEKANKTDNDDLISSQPDELSEDRFTDSKLQTSESDATLQTKLMNTYYAARTSIEEQGFNILYITLGMLHWYESDAADEVRLAPLILVPVSLERSSARERFRVKYSQEEIGENISLQAKLKNDFDVILPNLPESEDVDVEGYFNLIAGAIGKISKWKIETDRIELGFFSFGKFMIYNDLDADKWPESSKPFDQPLLVNLLWAGFSDAQPSTSEEAFIDHESKAHELFQVVDADSSQILAMLAVREGRNLIIQGPPGTGKSQTITNLIADAIGEGKRVLFVSEKMAALEVVKRRLNSINLGEPCLELHSHKSNKRELHQELKRVLELGKPTLGQLQQECSMLNAYKEELNDYCNAANAVIGESGLTFQQLAGRLLKVYDATKNISLPKVYPDNIETWSGDKMLRAESFADKIQTRLKDTGHPEDLLFWGCQLDVLLPHEQEALLKILVDFQKSTEGLRNQSADLSKRMGLSAPVDEVGVAALIDICRVVSLQPNLLGLSVKSNLWLLNSGDIDECLQAGNEMTLLEKKYDQILISDAWKQNVQNLRTNISLHGQKWYRVTIGSYRNSLKQFGALCQKKMPKSHHERLAYLNDIVSYNHLQRRVEEQKNLIGETFQTRWRKGKSDWAALKEAAKYLKDIHQGVACGDYTSAVMDYLSRGESLKESKQSHDVLIQLLANNKANREILTKKLKLNEELWLGKKKPLAEQLLIEQHLLVKDWIERLTEIHQSLTWNTLSDMATEAGFSGFIRASFGWSEATNYLKIALQKTWYEHLMGQAHQNHAVLRRFERSTHEQTAEQFRNHDSSNLRYNRARVALKHWEGLPRLEAGGQVNLLKAEFHKKARLKPIRKIIAEAGLAIQAIKPVFMMSPMSIANFLPQGGIQFDLVIFDEASQVRPVEALGAILRGSQVVVVGDSKQLPPTSFFDSLASDAIENEDNVTADIQSILGMCDAQGAPQRMLRWHYRSRHESLINLSNHEFYENKLVVFPSPGSKQQTGLTFSYLADTYYDRGKTRTNPKEAEAVVNAVLDHARRNPKQSLGVVAFSTAQRQAIQDILEQKRRQHEDVEPFFRANPDEPFFIKNLENVQGDERDVILISLGYGRSEDGHLAMSFGPLNNEGGERRLNVLITRAKLRCQVFANIKAADIDISRTKSHGVRALKNFLYYAEHGRLNTAEETNFVVESPFEDLLAEKLTQTGLTVRRQVGSRAFNIDLAIVDEDNPGRYIMGIECDGATYHSARSARDRDRLRKMVLENIGWKIHRVWSIDWFKNQDRELQRVLESVAKFRAILTIQDEALEDEVKDILTKTLDREIVAPNERETIHYQTALLPDEIRTQEIHLHPIGKIALWITNVVEVEGPVHINEVARRIGEAAGVARIGARISEHLEFGIKAAELGGQIKKRGGFLWMSDMTTPIPRNRSKLSASSRKMEYIAPEEICAAVEMVVRDSIAIQPHDCVPYIAKILGFNRVTEEMKNELLKAVGLSIQLEIIKQEGDLLKV
jgi:very-short-patch-repair endonuclease/DNA polymerase III delta prime subunit